VDPADSIDFLAAAEAAGSDYVSLCLHSTMAMFVSRGLSSALLRPEHRARLREQVSGYVKALSRPFIPKIGLAGAADAERIVGDLVEAGVACIHANLGSAPAERSLRLIPKLKERVPLLIIGGGVSTPEEAARVIEAGADAVAIGSAAMKDPGLCGLVQRALRAPG